MSEPQLKVFINYAREQMKFAKQLAAFLKASNCDPFLDVHQHTGTFRDRIGKAIRECDVFLLLLCKESNQSPEVEREVGQAAKYDKRMVVIEVEAVHQLSDTFDNLLNLANRITAGDQPLAHTLIATLAAILDSPTLATALPGPKVTISSSAPSSTQSSAPWVVAGTLGVATIGSLTVIIVTLLQQPHIQPQPPLPNSVGTEPLTTHSLMTPDQYAQLHARISSMENRIQGAGTQFVESGPPATKAQWQYAK